MAVRTVREWLLWGRDQLSGEAAALEAEVLLAWAGGWTRVQLFADLGEVLPGNVAGHYQKAIRRRQEHEPVAYIVGERWFYGLPFWVTPAVLVPRPETEELVEKALVACAGMGELWLADVGCGSGVLAVALARNLPQARVVAVDISAAALVVARENARRHKVASRITFVQGDLLAAVAGPFHLIVANLPYVSQAEYEALPPDVQLYEPESALFGGEDGLEPLRRLLPQVRHRLLAGGTFIAEIGWQQGKEALRLTAAHLPGAEASVEMDLAGEMRFLVIKVITKTRKRAID